MHCQGDNCQSQGLYIFFALHELEWCGLFLLTIILLSLPASHELLAVTIRHRNAAELSKDLLQSVLWDVLESSTQVTECEFELRWHPVQSDQAIEVYQSLDSLLLLILLFRPVVSECLFSYGCDKTAEKLFQAVFVLLAKSFASVLKG